MKGFMPTELIFGIIIIVCVIISVIIYGIVIKSYNKISKEGLKPTLEQIWNGPDKKEKIDGKTILHNNFKMCNL